MGLRDYDYSSEELLAAVIVHPHASEEGVSILRTLDYMIGLSRVRELTGECDGIDALCYHLDGHVCEDVIKILERVAERLKLLDAKETKSA